MHGAEHSHNTQAGVGKQQRWRGDPAASSLKRSRISWLMHPSGPGADEHNDKPSI